MIFIRYLITDRVCDIKIKNKPPKIILTLVAPILPSLKKKKKGQDFKEDYTQGIGGKFLIHSLVRIIKPKEKKFMYVCTRDYFA